MFYLSKLHRGDFMFTNTVTILLAIYNPNIKWLEQLLISLNNQTFSHLDLIAIDDYSVNITFTEIKNIFEKSLKKIPYKLIRNEKNLGSNATFEKLVSLAQGKYIALCDQDDVWHREKLSWLMGSASKENSALCYGDYEIMDAEGRILSDSARKYFKRYYMLSGDNLASYFLTKNFVPGCMAIISSDIAKASIPFVQNMVHDHWLALNAALKGNITFVEKSLVKYRIHSSNQTGILKGIENKNDYIKSRVLQEQKRFAELSERFHNTNLPIESDIKNLLEWTNARLNYFNGHLSAIFTILKHMGYNKYLSLFDIIVMKLPAPVFKKVIKMIINRRV